MAYGETGRYPLYITCYIRVLKYYFHMLHMSNDRIPEQVYLMLRNLDEQGEVNRASKTKEILYSVSFGFVWEEQWVGNEREFLSIFKQRLIDMFRQNWTAKLRGSDRYKVFRTFKFLFQKTIGHALESEKLGILWYGFD